MTRTSAEWVTEPLSTAVNPIESYTLKKFSFFYVSCTSIK